MLEHLINNNNVIKIIEFGSIIYGTNTKNSDVDYIVIVNEHYNITNSQIKIANEDFSFYNINDWNLMCNFNDLKCIEVYFSDNIHYIKGKKDKIIIDYDLIRSNFSAIASNSYVKCKKKLTVKEDFDPYIAKKSLFHSLRILMFGIQIMKFGKIVDFSEANKYYNEIVNNDINDWSFYKSKYQSIYNNLKTEFRKEHKMIYKRGE